jgi:subtilase family serine protease
MTQLSRSRRLVRRQPAASLERLEERQLLSTLPIGNSPVLPPISPAVASATVTLLPNAGGFPSALYAPSQIRTAYGVNLVSQQGQGETIAIVDAFAQPDIASDINTFSTRFGLPKMDGINGDPTLSILVPTGQTAPGYDPGWGLEISLDVEWAHSIAPNANIDLITCQDAGGDSLFGAEVDSQPYASGVVYAESLPGVVVVSNSYGGPEFSTESNYDVQFTKTPNVAVTYSTGDNGAPGEYPAYSPNVVAVGGTSLATRSIRGAYGVEAGWSGSGGGTSQFESVPSYQSNNGVNFGARSIPDVSMDADGNTGVFVLDTPGGGYFDVGGTSLSCPMWAGVIAIGDQALGTSLSSTSILGGLYGAYNSANYSTDFHDVTTGNNGHAAGPGYDQVTGIGTPKVPGIVSLFSSLSPAHSPGTPAASSPLSFGTTGQSSASAVAGSHSRFSVSIYSPPGVTLVNSTLSMGSLTNLLTTMDISAPKKPGSLLGSS